MLHGVEVGARFQFQLQRCYHALHLEDAAGKAYRGDEVVAVVLGLIDREYHARRDERVGHKAIGIAGHINELTLALRGKDGEKAIPLCSEVEGLGQAYAWHTIL